MMPGRSLTFVAATLLALGLGWGTPVARGQEPEAPAKPAAEKAANPTPAAGATATAAALEKLKLPGVKINLDERCVDVDSTICLSEGALELIACTKDSKEHESILVIDAKAMHIHTALLLLGAKAGTPAMMKAADKEQTRWIHVPPSGGPVGVFLVFPGKDGKLVERPISDFIVASEDDWGGGDDQKQDKEKQKFPTHTFLFAGSHLVGDGPGPRKYLCDQTGNVISIATFGDELLCLPDVHSNENGALLWQIESTGLPDEGSKVTLRLRPQFKAKMEAEDRGD
jgi:hypothetical protein